MPAKTHIHTEPAPPRFRPVGKLGIVDWREDCSNCHNCVKRGCVYGFYRDEADTLREQPGYLDYIYQCKGCLNCVQDCTKGILTRVVNPEYLRLGDGYYTPQIVLSTWFQSESGRIPVSGAGYGGPFSGSGFDSMWTDMSEIVRPTRDGIHGREYISTSVDIGRKPAQLAFEDGRLCVAPPPLLESPLPVFFDAIPKRWHRGKVVSAIARAAAQIGIFSVIRSGEIPRGLSIEQDHVIPWLESADRGRSGLAPDLQGLAAAAMVMVPDCQDSAAVRASLKEENAECIVAIRLPANPAATRRVVELVEEGAEVIHLVFDAHGREDTPAKPRHMRDVLREIHAALVKEGTRDLVTLSASGGIALAEHVAKAVICGADLVAIDIPLGLALECRLCGECERGELCQIAMEDVEEDYAVRRVVNLLGAWHQQLIELLGAMGIREVRRLRGETGRSMFFEDLERETFGRLFGKRKGDWGLGISDRIPHSMPTTNPQPPIPNSRSPIPNPQPPTHIPRTPIPNSQSLIPNSQSQAPIPNPQPPTKPQSAEDFLARPDYAEVPREVRPAPPRYRNEIGKFSIYRSSDCIACGRCAETCRWAVHVRPDGYRSMVRPLDYRCIGPRCAEKDDSCLNVCPQKALSLCDNPAFKTIGDCRWTADLLVSTWQMAETGHAAGPHLESETGGSGGGFDRLRLRFPPAPPEDLRRDDISTELLLNRRHDHRPKVKIDVPWYGGGMSFGSTSTHVLIGRARAAKAWNTFTCTGEGGYLDRLIPYKDQVITQVATGLFGVREETIQRARIVEFKYAQGAKPGLGGHLLGDKNTPPVAAMREAVVGTSLFSPFPFHSIYSVEDHKKHLDWIAHVNPQALLSAKVSTPVDVDMVAVGSYYAGAHIVHLDGSYGGTGAAPNIAKKNIAMPIEYAIHRVHQFLVDEGIRDEITVIASGGIRNPADMAKAIALGADGVVVGTGELVAVGCIRCGNCESGRGCARGITTTDPGLMPMTSIEWATRRLVNLYHAWREMFVEILYRLGLDSVAALRGRTELLTHLDYEDGDGKW